MNTKPCSCAFCADLALLGVSPSLGRDCPRWHPRPELFGWFSGWIPHRAPPECAFGTDRIIGDLVPFFVLPRPGVNGLEASRVADLVQAQRDRAIIWRGCAVEELGNSRPLQRTSCKTDQLAKRLERELSKCRANGSITAKLSELVLAIPTCGNDVEKCQRVLRRYHAWFEERLDELISERIELRHTEDIEPLTAFHRTAEVVIAGLIPPSELGLQLAELQYQQLSAEKLVSLFRPIIRPSRCIALPPAFERYRPHLYEVICHIFEESDDTVRCDAFELFARLTPAPFDLLNDLLQRIEASGWLTRLNVYQLARVSLILADIVAYIPASPKFRGIRDQWSRRLVRWLEGESLPHQFIGREVIYNLFEWFHRLQSERFPSDLLPWLGVYPFWSDEYDSSSLDSITNLMPNGLEFLWLVVTRLDKKLKSHPPLLQNYAELEASLFKAIVSDSGNELARTKSLWNLTSMQFWGPQYVEVAAEAYHCGYRRCVGSVEATRALLRLQLPPRLHEFGPVNPEASSILEAAVEIIDVVDRNWHEKLTRVIARQTGQCEPWAEERLQEFYLEVLTHPKRCKFFAKLCVTEPWAIARVITVLKRWLIDAHRRWPIRSLDEVASSLQSADCADEYLLTHAVKVLQNFPCRLAAAGTYWRLSGHSRKETAELLQISQDSLDRILKMGVKEMARSRVYDELRTILRTVGIGPKI